MANIFWRGEKASPSDIQRHIMSKAEAVLGGKTNFAFSIDDGAAQLWIECEDPNDETTSYWSILDSEPKIMGWRTLIFKCPVGFLEAFETQKNLRVIHIAEEQKKAAI